MDTFLCHPEKMSGSDHVTLLTPGEFILLELEEIRAYVQKSPLPENEAAMEWIRLYSKKFRETWKPFVAPKELIPVMRAEIDRHRWIESEKKRQDLGILAEMDWIFNYRKFFFEHYRELGKLSQRFFIDDSDYFNTENSPQNSENDPNNPDNFSIKTEN